MKVPPELTDIYNSRVKQVASVKPEGEELQFWTHEPGEPFRLMTQGEVMDERAAAGAKMMASVAPGKVG